MSRKVVSLNLDIEFLIPFTKPFYLQGLVYYRYGTIFRQIIDTKKIEICGVVDGVDTNLLIKLLIDMIKSEIPDLVHKCPYTGDFELKNFTFNMDVIDKATMTFPQGIYRYDFFLYIHDVSSLNVSTIVEVKSQLKESFG